MKFHCGLTRKAKNQQLRARVKQLKQWHPWFAWYPVTIDEDNGRNVCVWLQTIQRRGIFYMAYSEELLYMHVERLGWKYTWQT